MREKGKQSWQRTAARKRSETLKKIPQDWLLPQHMIEKVKGRRRITGGVIEGLIDHDVKRITQLDSLELVDMMGRGDLTAVQVVTAFCKRAAIAHQLNDNLLDVLFAPALQRAAELDRYFEEYAKPIGPLHGLPFSVKDQFHVRDSETTMAYVGWIGTFEGQKGTSSSGKVESELVRQLVSLGAVPIAKTTLTQTLWCAETDNNILGYNWNPCNQFLSSGGSSGGQAAFQALRGSPLGLGTDIGGSVSIPAAFNGIYSIKPSSGRLSFRCVPNSSEGQSVIPTVAGIFGTSISCLQLSLKAIVEAKPWENDPDVLPLKWDPKAKPKILQRAHCRGLSFGIMRNDGKVKPHPPILRALGMVEEALKLEGHDVVEWKPPSHGDAEEIHAGITNADGQPDVVRRLKLSGEPVISELRTEFGDHPHSPMPLPKFYSFTERLHEYRRRYHDYWMSNKCGGEPVDAVILPVAPHAAVIPGKWYHYSYGTIANTLDYTTITIPVTTASSEIDVFDYSHQQMNELDRENWQAYDPQIYDGAPASVQILGRRLEEEKLLAVAEIVVNAIKRRWEGRQPQLQPSAVCPYRSKIGGIKVSCH